MDTDDEIDADRLFRRDQRRHDQDNHTFVDDCLVCQANRYRPRHAGSSFVNPQPDALRIMWRVSWRVRNWHWQQPEHLVLEDHLEAVPFLHLPPIERGMALTEAYGPAELNSIRDYNRGMER